MQFDPNPLEAGARGKIVGGVPGATVKLNWDPPGQPSQVTLDKNGEVSFTTPRGATSVVAEDEFGNQASAIVAAP